MSDPRRSLPSVDALLASEAFAALLDAHPRGRVVGHLRAVLGERRQVLAEAEGKGGAPGAAPEWAEVVRARLAADEVPSLRPVINATGVVLHTNLGRAPLAEAARRALDDVARGYANLEYDLEEGSRGSRYDHCSELLEELTGAAAAVVVNNAAAALVLALDTVARDRGVAVSRGELVEIGGGFRIPEILGRSGAHLVEVGSTNRTRLQDYAEAMTSRDVAAILKVHRSNFRIRGFTEEASLPDLAALAHESGLPLIHDLGSGLLVDPATLGLPDEPRASSSLEAGADLVIISGDKLLGGPQAGIVLGGEKHVHALRTNPLCRALRVDKGTLAALEATLRLYLRPDRALHQIPALRMLSTPEPELHARAEALALRLDVRGGATVEQVSGAVGGGTYPDVEIPSWAVVLRSSGVQALAAALRAGDPPVVGRIEDDRLILDVRTVSQTELDALVRRVTEALGDTP